MVDFLLRLPFAAAVLFEEACFEEDLFDEACFEDALLDELGFDEVLSVTDCFVPVVLESLLFGPVCFGTLFFVVPVFFTAGSAPLLSEPAFGTVVRFLLVVEDVFSAADMAVVVE